MDRVAITDRITEFVKKYKYVLIVLVVGVFLMLLPGKQEQTEAETEEVKPSAKNEWDITEKLTEILKQVKGAGDVKVLLTVANGQTTVYQYDEDISGGENGSVRQETVIVTDSDRNQSGLVQQINPPVYQGAIIVCQGADNDVVRLHIIEAVAKVTGLRTDKISVLKMK